VDGVLGVCHTSKGSRADLAELVLIGD
jgi:hypothetical protein